MRSTSAILQGLHRSLVLVCGGAAGVLFCFVVGCHTSKGELKVAAHDGVDVEVLGKVIEENTVFVRANSSRRNVLNTSELERSLHPNLSYSEFSETFGTPYFEYWAVDLDARATLDPSHRKYRAFVYLGERPEDQCFVFLFSAEATPLLLKAYEDWFHGTDREIRKQIWPKELGEGGIY